MAKKKAKGKRRGGTKLEDLPPHLRELVEAQFRGAPAAAALEVLGRDMKPDNVTVDDRDMKPANVTKPRMNKTEAAYAQLLKARQAAGSVLWFEFEWASLRLAKSTHYRPDFAVLAVDYENDNYVARLEFHEVKGFWRDDARAKIKIAADKFPFHFLAVQKRKKAEGGGWAFEHFPGAEAGTRG